MPSSYFLYARMINDAATVAAFAVSYPILAAVLWIVGAVAVANGEALARAVSEAGGEKGVSYPASALEVADTWRKIGEAGARSRGRAEVAHDAGVGVVVLSRRS